MKKLLALTLSLASMVFVAPSTEAKVRDGASSQTTIVGAESIPQQRRNPGIWGRRNNRRAHVTTQTRLVRYGRQLFRETYQVRYLPNGRTQVMLISRVRVR
ncbi:MAG TPA: hypothetical protein VGC66_17125 [Pyrinomonadaceae bacterium]